MKCKSKKMEMLAGQAGFSMIEVLFSAGILMIAIVSYLSTRSKTVVSLSTTEVQQNLVALRHFIRTNFSCEETMEKNGAFKREDGFVESQGCPKLNPAAGSIVAYNLDGNPLLGHKPNVRVGNYRIWSQCIEEPTTKSKVKIPQFRFLAQALDKDGKPLRDTFDKSKIMRNLDVFDGMTIPCQMVSEPLPPRPGQGCSITMRYGGKLTNNITGSSFRNRSDKVVFEMRSAFDDSDMASYGKPYAWRFKWVNKSPKDSYSGSGSLATSPFVITANAKEYPSAPPGRMPECAPTSDPALAEVNSLNPNCKYWGEFIPLSSFQTPSKWFDSQIDLVAEVLDKGSKKIGDCTASFKIVDPLILTWQPLNEPPQKMRQSIAEFDYDGRGTKQRINWIYGDDVAYLSLDLNNNGEIDSGKELFSDFMAMSDGRVAKHGFEALSQFDNNHDGFIDAQDPIYNKLRLWFDIDGNAVSEPEELIRLNDVGVTRVGLSHKSTDYSESLSNVGARVAYEGVFYDRHKCAEFGCRSFDVFFSFESENDQ